MTAYSEQAEVFRRELEDLCLTYVQEVGGGLGSPGAKRIWEVRDSTLTRLWSVGWHINLLREREAGLSAALLAASQPLQDDPSGYLKARLHLFFLFDDVIFNALSLVDYFASLISRVHPVLSSDRMKWNSLAKAAGDSKNPISATHSAQLIFARHKSLMTQLQDYRAGLIHYRGSSGKVGGFIDLRPGSLEPDLTVPLPKALVRRIPQLKGRRMSSGPTPFQAAIIIGVTLLHDLSAILEPLRAEVLDGR